MERPDNILLQIVNYVQPRLRSLNEAEVAAKSSPERWSKKEIVGHLIDSASNNHRRFVRAQYKVDLLFSGYQQENWVKSQSYHDADWAGLVDLWISFNAHMAHLIAHIPEMELTKIRTAHNLHEIAFKRIKQDEPTSLLYFIWDYIAHQEHHIKQIFEDYQGMMGSYANNFHL